MDMSEHSIKDLGTFVDMFAEAGYFKMARSYLNEIAERLGAMEALNGESVAAKLVRQMQENKLLAELPLVETKEPVLKYEPIIGESLVDEAKRRGVPVDIVAAERIDAVVTPQPIVINNVTEAKLEEGIRGKKIMEKWEADGNEAREEPKGPPRDESGHITRISVKLDDPGYDAEAHENTKLKIYCDGKHIETAHTGDEIEGCVWYHKKNEQGRIKTLTVHGKVEIKGLD